MYQNKSVCVVIPAHNEATQILRVLTTLPEWVDHIVVVDDASTDATADVVTGQAQKDGRVVLLRHDVNQGCGGALVSGYRWAIEHHVDIAVRMDGVRPFSAPRRFPRTWPRSWSTRSRASRASSN